MSSLPFTSISQTFDLRQQQQQLQSNGAADQQSAVKRNALTRGIFPQHHNAFPAQGNQTPAKAAPRQTLGMEDANPFDMSMINNAGQARQSRVPQSVQKRRRNLSFLNQTGANTTANHNTSYLVRNPAAASNPNAQRSVISNTLNAATRVYEAIQLLSNPLTDDHHSSFAKPTAPEQAGAPAGSVPILTDRGFLRGPGPATIPSTLLPSAADPKFNLKAYTPSVSGLGLYRPSLFTYGKRKQPYQLKNLDKLVKADAAEHATKMSDSLAPAKKQNDVTDVQDMEQDRYKSRARVAAAKFDDKHEDEPLVSLSAGVIAPAVIAPQKDVVPAVQLNDTISLTTKPLAFSFDPKPTDTKPTAGFTTAKQPALTADQDKKDDRMQALRDKILAKKQQLTAAANTPTIQAATAPKPASPAMTFAPLTTTTTTTTPPVSSSAPTKAVAGKKKLDPIDRICTDCGNDHEDFDHSCCDDKSSPYVGEGPSAKAPAVKAGTPPATTGFSFGGSGFSFGAPTAPAAAPVVKKPEAEIQPPATDAPKLNFSFGGASTSTPAQAPTFSFGGAAAAPPLAKIEENKITPTPAPPAAPPAAAGKKKLDPIDRICTDCGNDHEDFDHSSCDDKSSPYAGEGPSAAAAKPAAAAPVATTGLNFGGAGFTFGAPTTAPKEEEKKPATGFSAPTFSFTASTTSKPAEAPAPAAAAPALGGAAPSFSFNPTATTAPAAVPTIISSTVPPKAPIPTGKKLKDKIDRICTDCGNDHEDFDHSSCDDKSSPYIGEGPSAGTASVSAAPGLSFNTAGIAAPATTGFSFGGSKDNVGDVNKLTTSTATPAPTFAFGANTAPTAAPTATPAPTFAFGPNTAAPAAAATSAPTFAFGANTAVAAPAAAPAPTFAFGANTVPPAATPTPAFGANSAATSTAMPAFGANSTAPTPSFSFGASSATPAGTAPAFGANTAAAPPAPSFAFGGAAPAATPFGATPTPAFGANTAAQPFGANGTVPAFGANTAASQPFGATPAATPFGANTAGPAFGAPPAAAAFGAPPAPSFSFGGAAPAQGGFNPGLSTSSTAGSAFGANNGAFPPQSYSATPAPSTGAFGPPTNAFGPPGGGAGFAAPGGFSQPQKAQPFGAQIPPGANSFNSIGGVDPAARPRVKLVRKK